MSRLHDKTLTPKPEARVTAGHGPAWRIEHAQSVQRICLTIKRGLGRGVPVRTMAAQAARRWNGKPFRCDPARKFNLGVSTVVRFYYAWRAGGELPSAVRLRYQPPPPVIPAPLLCRFIEFCAALPFRSMNAAWGEFTRRKGWFRRGKPGHRPVAFCYDQVQRYFKGGQFAQLQAAQRNIESAQQQLTDLRLRFTAEIRARFPDRPQRRRRTGAELSLEAARL